MISAEIKELVLWLIQSIMHNVMCDSKYPKNAPPGSWAVITKLLQVLQKEGMINANDPKTYTHHSIREIAKRQNWRTADVAASKPKSIRGSFLPGELGTIGVEEIIQAINIFDPTFDLRTALQGENITLQDKNEDGDQRQALADSEQGTASMKEVAASIEEGAASMKKVAAIMKEVAAGIEEEAVSIEEEAAIREEVAAIMEEERFSKDESWKGYLDYENCLPEGHL
ncbi:hypothetical protein EYC80_002421 [Monilinia laxa]|uniref:Uncharacterized protein n=1 Tax=Monilinia laxa TaxID=61186 RepID=A0A5N6K3Y0_MONLA|nr:hypothetical protein EYC80_002421 [Monilinia laxa]